MGLFAPLLSEYDPVTSLEGTIDPLGLYAIADSLALKLVPGVRERQSHPRFLTAIAVSAVVCSDFDEETVASDGVSEPWQVFEWYVVEGLVRTFGDSDDIVGLPGRDKAKRAIRDRLPLCARCYLKTPSVFGFHGVYKVLAENLDIVNSGMLGATGYALVSAWEKEEGLRGFHSKQGGPGAAVREQLRLAVSDAITRGAVDRSAAWAGWSFFREHLAPYRFKTKEADVVAGALTSEDSDIRKQVIRFLTSEAGQRLWRETQSERKFHQALGERASPELRALLDAISRYEEFCRLMQNAFDECLILMTEKRGKMGSGELAASRHVVLAAQRVPEMFADVSDHLQTLNETGRFEQTFSALCTKTGTKEWVELLMDHHIKTQKNKPPNGKSPWFAHLDDGGFIVRPGYRQDRNELPEASIYVHAYRTNPLWSFMRDLRLVTL